MGVKKIRLKQQLSQSGTIDRMIVSQHFTDVEQFADFFTYNQMQLIQLTPGPLQSDFLSARIGDIYFTRIRANQSIQVCGSKHQDYVTFAMVWSAKSSHFYAHTLPLSLQTSLFGFDRQREVDLISPPQGMMTEIFIPIKTFQTYADRLQRHDIDDRFLAANHISLLPDRMEEIKHYLRDLFWVVEHKADWVQQPQALNLIANDLVPLLIQSIPIKGRTAPALKSSRRSRLIAQAEQEMVAHLDKPLTLKDLAKRLGSSSSALSYGFQDLFGMSPMRYLKVRRLNGVRQCLKASDPDRCKIETLANQFGFWSAGHFARDYKAMFGELPSETLHAAATVK